MSFDEFIQEFNGKPVDFDGHFGVQCMDLMHYYHYNVLQLTDRAILAAPCAKNLFLNFDSIKGREYFDKIPNTPDAVPQRGDIIIWGEPFGKFLSDNGQEVYAGHVAIFIDGDVNRFRSFDANFGERNPHIQQHENYNGVLGWLRPKTTGAADGTYYKGYDLANPESMKIAVDNLLKVVNGDYIDKNTAVNPDVLQQQVNATSQCQTQLKTALDQNEKYQQELNALQEELKDVKSKYDEEHAKNIDLYAALKKVSESAEDLDSKNYVLEKKHNEKTEIVKEVAKELNVSHDPSNDKDLLPRIMEKLFEWKDSLQKQPQPAETIGQVTSDNLVLPQNGLASTSLGQKNHSQSGGILQVVMWVLSPFVERRTV